MALFVGILFDVECYSTPLIFDWADNNSFTHKTEHSTVSSYQPQVRLRAKQIMQQIQAGWPGCRVLVTYGPEMYASHIWRDNSIPSSQTLLSTFSTGLFEGQLAYGGQVVNLNENYYIYDWSTPENHDAPHANGGFDVKYKHTKFSNVLDIEENPTYPGGPPYTTILPTTLMPDTTKAEWSDGVINSFMVYDLKRNAEDTEWTVVKPDDETQDQITMCLRRSEDLAVYYTNHYDWLRPSYVDAPLAPTSLKTAMAAAWDTAASRTYNTSWFYDNCQNGLGNWTGNTTPWRTVDTTKYDGTATKAIEKNNTGSAYSLLDVEKQIVKA